MRLEDDAEAERAGEAGSRLDAGVGRGLLRVGEDLVGGAVGHVPGGDQGDPARSGRPRRDHRPPGGRLCVGVGQERGHVHAALPILGRGSRPRRGVVDHVPGDPDRDRGRRDYDDEAAEPSGDESNTGQVSVIPYAPSGRTNGLAASPTMTSPATAPRTGSHTRSRSGEADAPPVVVEPGAIGGRVRAPARGHEPFAPRARRALGRLGGDALAGRAGGELADAGRRRPDRGRPRADALAAAPPRRGRQRDESSVPAAAASAADRGTGSKS